MIVDDSADVRYLIRVIVQDAGDEVVVVGEADGAASALDAIDGIDPDVVVLDARMPVVDGFEAAPMLLARRPGLKIVLCSALVDDVVRARAERAGITTCLTKDELDAIPGLARELAGG